MKKFLLFMGLIFYAFLISKAQEVLEKQYRAAVQYFIQCVKNNDVKALANKVIYPMPRPYPLPPIKDKQDFIRHYHEIFDDSLRNVIIHSDVVHDWSTAGFRGIMLNNGLLWLDYDGSLEVINRLSAAERKQRQQLIEEDRKNLCPALADFYKPVIVMKTDKYKFRIDQMKDGTYRFAMWNADEPMSQKPLEIIPNGKFNIEGSEGNKIYIFKTDNYEYDCFVNSYYEGPGTGSLLIYDKDNKEIYRGDAKVTGY